MLLNNYNKNNGSEYLLRAFHVSGTRLNTLDA